MICALCAHPIIRPAARPGCRVRGPSRVSFLMSAAGRRCGAVAYLVDTGPVECAVAGFGMAYRIPGQSCPGGGAGDDDRGLEAARGGADHAKPRQHRGGDPVAEQGIDHELVPEFGGAEDLTDGVASGDEFTARLPQAEGPSAGEPGAACYPRCGPAAWSARL